MPPLRDLLPNRRVVIVGYHIQGNLDLSNMNIDSEIRLWDGRIDGDVDLSNSAFARDVSLQGSHIGGDVDLSNSTFAFSIYLGNEETELRSQPEKFEPKRGGEYSRVGALILNHTKVGGDLYVKYATLSRVRGAQVVVGGNAIFKECSSGQIRLDHAIVSQQINVVGCVVRPNGPMDGQFLVDLARARAGDGIWLNRSTIEGAVLLTGTDVQGAISLLGTSMASITMLDARVSGSIELGENRFSDKEVAGTQWDPHGTFLLAGATFKSLSFWIGPGKSVRDYWPRAVDMAGASYGAIEVTQSSVGQGTMVPMGYVNQNSSSYLELLRSQRPFSADTYRVMGAALIKNGDVDSGREILYAGKVAERKNVPNTGWGSVVDRLTSLGLDLVVGYGYKLHRSVIWIVALVTIGAIVFRSAPEAEKQGIRFGIVYSLDMLLPFARLKKRHEDVDMPGWRRYYLYSHKLAGYVLAAFVATALSGLAR